MDYVTKKVLILDGLGCANCALKIENEVKNIEGVDSASVDFVSKKLTIACDKSQDVEKIVHEASQIAVEIEGNIKVLDENSAKEIGTGGTFINPKNLIKISVGGVLFALAIIFEFNYCIKLALYSVSYLIFGGDVLLHAVKNIMKGRVFDENFLMSVATIGAFSIGEFPEGVSVMLFYKIGETFQEMAVNNSRRSIKALMDIRPDYANLKTGKDIKRVTPGEVRIGDLIEVRPGEKIPLDGVVIGGESLVDTSMLTGESIPRKISAGDEVLGGFINQKGLVTIKVSKNFEETTVSKIIEMVQNSSSRKARTESFISKFAAYYTPVVVSGAAATAILPPIILSGASFSEWLYRALIFLVISCPCALVVSIPLSYFGGIGGASRNGILIKGGNYLEALNDLDIVVFDKTGTLTKGVFKVNSINPASGVTKNELLELAALAEKYSNHPIAESIKKEYKSNLSIETVEKYEELSGLGIKASVNGNEVLAGNRRLMEVNGIECPDVKETGTIVYLAASNKFAGCIVIADEIKEDSKNTISILKTIGVSKVGMLTGDNEAISREIAGYLGIDEVYAGLLPDQKVEKLEQMEKGKKSGKKLAFIGDGINDAPVIARADIGIAMGGLGSDAAIEAADVVFMSDEPSKIITAIKIAKRTRMIVWQNIFFALLVKTIVLVLGAGGIATMWEAVFADVGVALLAVLNAMRVMQIEKKTAY